MPSKNQPIKDDVEKLSRGLPTRGKIGSRGIGHRLNQKERILFEAAKRQGFLKIPANGARKNLENIFRLWCDASNLPCVIKSPLSMQINLTHRSVT